MRPWLYDEMRQVGTDFDDVREVDAYDVRDVAEDCWAPTYADYDCVRSR